MTQYLPVLKCSPSATKEPQVTCSCSQFLPSPKVPGKTPAPMMHCALSCYGGEPVELWEVKSGGGLKIQQGYEMIIEVRQ